MLETKNKVEINDIEQLNEILGKYNLSIEVLQDIDKRISNWLASGGNIDDNYIWQQCKYVENIINICNISKAK